MVYRKRGKKELKTATITFQSAENYGAFMQAFALQQFLVHDLSVENDILNYVSDEMKQHYQVYRKVDSIKTLIRNIIFLPFGSKIAKRKYLFCEEQKKYLKMTEEFKDIDGYKALIDRYDVCIAGSDQIWNLGSEDASELYFLPYAKRKISYAASAGDAIEHVDVEKYRELLCDFEKVSVREHKAAEYFEQLKLQSGKCVVCIDPTFLINCEIYKKMSGTNRIVKHPYIFYYSINNSKESMKEAAKIGKILGLPVITAYSRLSSVFAVRYGIKTMYEVGPSDFLNLIDNSEYVVTNSFHGTALSIILNKKFWRIAGYHDGVAVRDDRLDSILEISGLKSRIFNEDASDLNTLTSDIDWKAVKGMLNPKIEESKEYLRCYICEEK